MLRKDLLVVLGLVILWQTAKSDYNGLGGFFDDLNNEVLGVNHQTAQLAWDTNLDPFNAKKYSDVLQFADDKLKWKSMKCEQLQKLFLTLHPQQHRIYDVLCRGPKFTRYQQKKLIDLSDRIEKIYTSTRLCVPKSLDVCRDPEKLWGSTFVHTEKDVEQITFESEENHIKSLSELELLKCFTGEPELENLMANDALSSDVVACKRHKNEINYWVWEAWRSAVGSRTREIYPDLMKVMNEGAQSDGFKDIGDFWQREMELGEDVDALMKRLMAEVQPLYNMLHAFIKSVLHKKHVIKSGKNLPAHLLGWNSNWLHLFKEYVEPEFFKTSDWNIDEALKKVKWNPIELIKRVEDFYTSTGLSRMTPAFWNKSLITENQNVSCHGTAADMFKLDDFRVIVCGCKNLYDFYVVIHEIGHIEQYMMTQTQPAVFRAGNSIVQETIGDSFFLAMMTPMHLNRLRLIDDVKLFPSQNNDFDLHQLMMMAFMKLPEIPFGFVFEKFRYDLFAGRVSIEESNDYFWDMSQKYQRVEPPDPKINRHRLFDAAAKFHLAANVPYARYFFANILQYQVFRAMCEKTFYGKLNTNQTLPLPLHKCDVYGSKRAGTLLKKALQPGSALPLQNLLKTLTGAAEISADALMEYYAPLTDWLKNYLETNGIEY